MANFIYSISAIEDHDKCPRRRWFNKTCKLPQAGRKSPVFGDVAHAVAERFFEADDRGRNKYGDPVDLYPDKWQYMKNRFTGKLTDEKVTEEEAVLIKSLVNTAITEGLWIREPGRIVELPFRLSLPDLDIVTLMGFIDLANPKEVLDHKFVKNMNYALSVRRGAQRSIYESTQMMTYAWVRYFLGHKGPLDLSLMYYIKDYDAPAVKKRTVEVGKEEVDEFYHKHTLPSMKEMKKVDLEYPKNRVLDFRKVSPTRDPAKECNRHYGGPCPYINICAESCSIELYLKQFNKVLSPNVGAKTQKGPEKMSSLVDRILAENAQHKQAASAPQQEEEKKSPPSLLSRLTGGAPAQGKKEGDEYTMPTGNAQTPTEAVEPAPTETQENAPAQQTAPWYFSDMGECVACKDNKVKGYDSKMTPCLICDARARKAGKHASTDFIVESSEDGTLTFTLINDGTTTQIPVVEQPTTSVTEAPNSATENPNTTTETVSAPPSDFSITSAPSLEPTIISDPDPEGYTLLLGCCYSKGDVGFMDGDSFIKQIIEEVERDFDSVESLGHFKALEHVEAAAKDMVTKLSGTIVAYPTTKGSLSDRIIEVLRLNANQVITPMGI